MKIFNEGKCDLWKNDETMSFLNAYIPDVYEKIVRSKSKTLD